MIAIEKELEEVKRKLQKGWKIHPYDLQVALDKVYKEAKDFIRDASRMRMYLWFITHPWHYDKKEGYFKKACKSFIRLMVKLSK